MEPKRSVEHKISTEMAPKTYLSEKDARYQALLDIYKKVNAGKSYLVVQSEVNSMWKNELEEGTNPQLFTRKMDNLRAKLATKKSGIMKFMTRVPKPTKEVAVVVDSKELEVNNEGEVVVEENSGEEKEEWKIDNRKQTKVQDELRKKISVLEKKVLVLLEERSMKTMENNETLTAEIKKTRAELEVLRYDLKRKMNIQKSVQKCRQKRKELEERIRVENPDLAKAWNLRDGPGRPTIEETNPGEDMSEQK